MNKKTNHTSNIVLSVPNVSRERRCLQASPEQLMATKDTTKKTKYLNSVLGRPGEFLGSWNKIQTQQNCRISTPPEFSFGRTKIPEDKSRTIIRIFGMHTSLGCYTLECPTVAEGHKHRVTTPEKPRKLLRTLAEPRRDPAEASERPRGAL